MNIFPKDSIPAKMLADLKNLIKRNAKFDKKTLLGLIPLLIFAWAGNKIYCAYIFTVGLALGTYIVCEK